MKTLTANMEAERIKAGKDVYWLLEIDFPGELGTQYFSQRDIIISGHHYFDKLQSFSDGGKVIPYAFDTTYVSGAVSDFDFTLRNLPEDVDRFSDLIQEYGLDGFEVRIGLVFKPAGYDPIESDIIWQHTYLVNSYNVRSNEVLVRCDDISYFLLDKEIFQSISENVYPSAPSTSYGRQIPIIIGHEDDCPAIPVEIGARTTLDGSILAGDTIIDVGSVADFPNAEAGGFLIRIDKELILVRFVDRDNNRFGDDANPCERGFNDTEKLGYYDGTEVKEILDEYKFLVAGHKIKLIKHVRIGDKEVDFTEEYDAVNERHYINLPDVPESITAAAGTQRLLIDGSLLEDDVTKRWNWVANGDNLAENPLSAVDSDQLFTFAKVDRDKKILSLRLNDNLGDGENLYGYYKKLRFGITYQCSKRWGDETWPYFWVLRNGGEVKAAQFLQRPSEEDEKIQNEDHDHQEQSDWSIGDSRGLFEVKAETDSDLKNDKLSKSWQEGGQFWAEQRFTGLIKTDGTYKIQAIRWYALFDGAPESAVMKVTLANGRFYQKRFTEFAVPEEKMFELKVEAVGEILFQDIIDGNMIFRIEGTYDPKFFVQIDGRIEVDSNLSLRGQEVPLDQTQNRNRTEEVDLLGQGATSRVTQIVDYSAAAREFGGWGLFNGAIDFKLYFENPTSNDDTEIYVLDIYFEIEYQPLIKAIYEGDLRCDVDGFETYPGGIYYDNPVDVLRYILMDHYGKISEVLIDDGSFNDFKTLITPVIPFISRHVGDKRNLSELVNTLLREMRARLLFEGRKFYLKERVKSFQLSDSVFEFTQDYFSEKYLGKTRSYNEQIFNELGIYYNWNNLQGWFRRDRNYDDLISQGERWGLRRETLDIWWLGLNMLGIDSLADLALSLGAWKYTILQINNPLHVIHLERGDIVQITHDQSDLAGQVGMITGMRITGFDRLEVGLVFQDSLRIFQTANCRVEVDQAGGRWMKFYAMGQLLAILYSNGDFHFRYDFNMAGTSMLKGNDPGEGDLFVCHFLGGAIYGVAVPLPQTVGQCWLPMIVIGSIGVVRLFGSRVRTGIQNLSETIGNFVEWDVGNCVKLAPNGRDVVAKFEAVHDTEDPDYPGVWTFKGDLKERVL